MRPTCCVVLAAKMISCLRCGAPKKGMLNMFASMKVAVLDLEGVAEILVFKLYGEPVGRRSNDFPHLRRIKN